MENIKNVLKTLNWTRLLLFSLVIKAIIFSASFAEAFIILSILVSESFKFFIVEVKLKPTETSLRSELVKLETRLSSLESRDRIERMAAQTSTNTNTTPRRMF